MPATQIPFIPDPEAIGLAINEYLDGFVEKFEIGGSLQVILEEPDTAAAKQAYESNQNLCATVRILHTGASGIPWEIRRFRILYPYCGVFIRHGDEANDEPNDEANDVRKESKANLLVWRPVLSWKQGLNLVEGFDAGIRKAKSPPEEDKNDPDEDNTPEPETEDDTTHQDEENQYNKNDPDENEVAANDEGQKRKYIRVDLSCGHEAVATVPDRENGENGEKEKKDEEDKSKTPKWQIIPRKKILDQLKRYPEEMFSEIREFLEPPDKTLLRAKEYTELCKCLKIVAKKDDVGKLDFTFADDR